MASLAVQAAQAAGAQAAGVQGAIAGAIPGAASGAGAASKDVPIPWRVHWACEHCSSHRSAAAGRTLDMYFHLLSVALHFPPPPAPPSAPAAAPGRGGGGSSSSSAASAAASVVLAATAVLAQAGAVSSRRVQLLLDGPPRRAGTGTGPGSGAGAAGGAESDAGDGDAAAGDGVKGAGARNRCGGSNSSRLMRAATAAWRVIAAVAAAVLACLSRPIRLWNVPGSDADRIRSAAGSRDRDRRSPAALARYATRFAACACLVSLAAWLLVLSSLTAVYRLQTLLPALCLLLVGVGLAVNKG